MNIESDLTYILDPHSKHSCSSCIDLGIALIKHQTKFHSNFHANQDELLEILQNALIPNSNVDYNITISVIKIPVHKKLKCEPDTENNIVESEYTSLSDHVDWLKQEPDIQLSPKHYSSDDDYDNVSKLCENSVTLQKLQTPKRRHKKSNKSKLNNSYFGRQHNYICDFCSTEFTLKHLLIRHLKKEHISKPIKPIKSNRKTDEYKCDECNETFSKLMFYRSHLRRIHPDAILIRQKQKEENLVNLCDICGKGFEKVNALTCHRRTHLKLRPHACNICNKSFASFSHLTEHMNIHIGKKYKCLHENCDREYSHQSGMTRHYKVVHTLNQDYQCDFCPKRFSVHTKLTDHQRIHTGERPFACEFCGQRFRLMKNLKPHRRIHTGERPYKCKLCGKGFATNSGIRQHVLSKRSCISTLSDEQQL